MNIYLFEMRCLFKSLVGWCVGLCAFIAVYLSMYPMFESTGFDIAGLFARFPPALQSLFGMSGMDTRFYAGYLPFPIKLAEELAAIAGLVVGAFAVTHDHRQKCADFLFSKPVSRARVLLAKAGAVATFGAVLVCVLAVFLVAMAIAVAPGERLPFGCALALALIPGLMFLLYASVGILIGTVWPGIRGTVAIGVGAMFFFEIVLSVVKIITKNPDGVLARILVPVCAFDRGLAAREGRLEWPYVLLWICEVALLLGFAFSHLRRRDIG